MRQYIVSRLNKEAEFRKEDLISVKGGKIVQLHDVLARQLKDYVSSVAVHRTKQLSGISKMADSEFRREFIDSDEEVKTTILYGFLTKRDVFKTEDDEEYILGLAKHGGFKMVNMNLETVMHEELVDNSEELLDFIEKEKIQEDFKHSWAKSVKSAKEFIVSSSSTVKKGAEMKKMRMAMTRPRYRGGSGGSSENVKVDNIKKIESIVSRAIKKQTDLRGGILYLNQGELDEALSTLNEANKADFLARLEKVGDSFVFRTITTEQLRLDYEKLLERLRREQDKFKKTGKNKSELAEAVKQMQEFKGRVEEIARSFANLNVKDFMVGVSKEDRRAAYKTVMDKRREFWDLLYNKEAMEKRGLTVTASGQLHKILPDVFRRTLMETYSLKVTKSRKTGEITRKFVRDPIPKTIDWFLWRSLDGWVKTFDARYASEKKSLSQLRTIVKNEKMYNLKPEKVKKIEQLLKGYKAIDKWDREKLLRDTVSKIEKNRKIRIKRRELKTLNEQNKMKERHKSVKARKKKRVKTK